MDGCVRFDTRFVPSALRPTFNWAVRFEVFRFVVGFGDVATRNILSEKRCLGDAVSMQ